MPKKNSNIVVKNITDTAVTQPFNPEMIQTIQALDAAGIAFSIIDNNLTVIYHSVRAEKLLERINLGDSFLNLFSITEKNLSLLKKAIEKGTPEKITELFPHDHRFTISATISKVGEHALVVYEESASVLSSKDSAKDVIRFQKLSDSMSVALIMINRDLKITYWNRRAVELTGLSPKEAIGRLAEEIFPMITPSLATQFTDAFAHRRSFTIDRIPYHDLVVRGIFSVRAFFVEDELAVLIEDKTQQLRSEEQLRESEERFRAVSANMSVALAVINSSRKVIYWNKACETTSKGITAEYALGKDAYDVLPFKLETLERLIYGAHASPEGMKAKVYPEREGVKGTYDIRSFAVGDGVAFLLEDVTTQVRQSAELDRSNHELLDLYHNAPCGYLSVLASGNIIRMNLRMAEWLGFDNQETVEGNSILSILTPESALSFEREFQNSGLESPLVNIELEFKKVGTETFWGLVNAIPIYDATNHTWYWRWTIIDITELRAAQKQVEDSKLFSQLFNELGEAVLISDKEGRIIRANDAASRILGIPREELIGIPHDSEVWKAVLDDGTPVEPFELPGVRALREKKPVTNLEIGVMRPDGTLAWILESAAPLFDDQGEVAGVIVTFPEVTSTVAQRHALKDLNDRLGVERDRANEANRLKSSFLANMSHEIRTPMTAILGFSDILSAELATKVSEQHYTFLKSINVSGKRLLNLINDILDLSKIEAGRLELQSEELDLRTEIEASVTPLTWIAKQKSLELKVEHRAGRLGIRGDRQRFGQVLTNIIGNAIKFTRAGSITVATALNLNEEVEIAITDTGIGISEDFIPHLFEEFRQEHTGVTREFGGTGLGLAISKRLVTLMGGHISVKSKQGAGTTFTLTFPNVTITHTHSDPQRILKPTSTQAPPTPVVQPQDAVDKKLVLVVEDNIETQRLLEVYLKQQYRVIQAMNAGEVEARLKTYVPDVILMDVNLPGKDGLSITKDIRQGNVCPKVPIVALTAFAMTGDRERCLDAGCNDYLSKPATKREVLEVVDRMLKLKSV